MKTSQDNTPVIRYSIWLLAYIVFFLYASTSPLQKYSSIAQDPGTGVHTTRIFGFALVDVVATLILALILFFVLRRFGREKNIISVFFALVFLSVPIHLLFGVNTKLISLLG